MMKKKLNLILFATILFFVQCIDDPINTQQDDIKNLEYLYESLHIMANNTNCVNDENLPVAQRGFSFVAFGSKACGGPVGYMIYSNAIDKTTFLERVKQYTEEEKKYNKKWGIASDCMYEAEPKKVECIDGKPKLIY